MKKVFAVVGVLLLASSGQVLAQNYGKLLESVDKEKAADSVDAEKLKGAYKKGDVDYKAAYDSVDKDKVQDSVDMDKAKAALLEK